MASQPELRDPKPVLVIGEMTDSDIRPRHGTPARTLGP